MAGFDISGVMPADAANLSAEIRKLQRSRSYRDGCNLFYVEGVRNFVRAVESGLEIVAIFHSKR